MNTVLEIGKKAKEASRQLAIASTEVKNKALLQMANTLKASTEKILSANAVDLEAARKEGVSSAILDRLFLNEARLDEMVAGLRDIVRLPDPVGEIIHGWKLANGLLINKVRVPLGVVGIIYEGRPNVTVDAASLCLKAGNAVILRGSDIAFNSNSILTDIIASVLTQAGLPENSIQLIREKGREVVAELMKLYGYVDVLIPRGGAGLIKTVVENSSVPVIETGVGNCHVYIDAEADLHKAAKIVINAKTQRPGVCNAMETLLVHREIAKDFLPSIIKELQQKNVVIYGCPITRSMTENVQPATEADWETEYLDLKLAVRVVESLDEAIAHIEKYGTKHSEAIVTENYLSVRRFTEEIDAAAIYVNASTRFTDGGQFGFGAEIGISTQKLHARGPMALPELTSIKYVAYGTGQIRE